MREILFRGKSVYNEEWFYGDLLTHEDVTQESIEIRDYINRRQSPVFRDTVGQYTGLTDKNGKKIFEGDVLSIHNSSIGLYVALTEFQWQCLSPENKYYRHRLENNPQKYEVVGNIHDNPELLEVKE